MNFLWPASPDTTREQFAEQRRRSREADGVLWEAAKFLAFWLVVDWVVGLFRRRPTARQWVRATQPCGMSCEPCDCGTIKPEDITVTISGTLPDDGSCDYCLSMKQVGAAIKAARLTAAGGRWKLRHSFYVAFNIPTGVQRAIEHGRVTPRPEHVAVYTTVLGLPRSLFSNTEA